MIAATLPKTVTLSSERTSGGDNAVWVVADCARARTSRWI